MVTDDIDPEIAALVSDVGQSNALTPPKRDMAQVPVKEKEPLSAVKNNDLAGEFKKIEVFYNSVPHEIFDDTNYYKKVLGGEGDVSQKLHGLLTKFLTCQDMKDRAVYRQQIVTAYWEFLRTMVPRQGTQTVSAKKYLFRYGLLLPSLLTPEQKTMFAEIIDIHTDNEPVYYLDEWFQGISKGVIGISTTDEARPSKRDDNSRFQQLQSKAQGKLQSVESFLKAKENERSIAERDIRSKLEAICERQSLTGLEQYDAPYSENQKKTIIEMNEKLKNLLKIDKELNLYVEEYREARGTLNSLSEKLSSAELNTVVNSGDLLTELDTIRQMSKMTVGRQGNHFPILTREYFHCIPRGLGTRENILDVMRWIESIDPGAFCRVHKNQQNRIVPFVILLPTYGDTGFCWEPFDRYNRITSRGRIAVPMYPKNLQVAILTAVADLRWQVAKEKASYYWMEEGLTGQYYQWFADKKLKGDLKDYFINDYLLWMTKESEGVQRLDKEVRAIFWRHMPFPQKLKEILKTRSLVYQELCQRDMNRQMSDGY